MAGSDVRVGVVGRGFGRYGLVPAFRRDPRTYICAIATTSLESARSASEQLAIPAAYGSWSEMLSNEDLDAVAVATPPGVQAEILDAAIESGLAVFAEKPLAASADRAQNLAEKCRSAGVANVVDFIFPELQTWARAFEMVQQDAIGKIEMVTVDWTLESHDVARNADTWKTTRVSGGGALSHFGSHACHYLEKFAGPISSVSGRLSRPARISSDGDSIVALALEFASGAIGTVNLSTSAPFDPGHRMVLYGERGTITLSNPSSRPVSGFSLFFSDRRGERPQQLLSEDVAPTTPELDDRVPAVSRLASRFITWATGGISTSPTFDDGFRSQQIVEACRQSDQTGRKIELPSPASLR